VDRLRRSASLPRKPLLKLRSPVATVRNVQHRSQRKRQERGGKPPRFARVPFHGPNESSLSGRYQGMHLAMNVKYAFQP
jgi:hypothetical protein